MRERIYLPVVRFGVPHTDWKYVFFLTFAGFVLPFIFRITIYGVPAPMLTGITTLAVAVAFFNFIRIGRRPFWFQHTLRALVSSPVRRAALPTDDLNESWVKAVEDNDRTTAPTIFQFGL
ncbi:MAG: hypothetical protein ACJ741_08050 [Pyrinomonadaceae bacterium]